jgi:hypothetical protein
MGGLGNQMLQYAIGRNLTIKKNLEHLWIDLSWYHNTKNDPFFREFELNKLNTKYKTLDHKNVIWKLRFTNHFKSVNPFKYTDVIEKEYALFDPTILESGNNILLQGFFPSYKYFSDIKETLQTELVPKQKMNSANLGALDKIKSVNSVSVHFRRGDYALTGVHGILDKSYYERALIYLSKKFENIELFIFSDEPEWVAQNMYFEFPYHIMDFNKGDSNYFDLELMKNCKHNIIANSTFSWWAAWLNPNSEKIVVAPKHWLNVDINKMQNIPEGWMLV